MNSSTSERRRRHDKAEGRKDMRRRTSKLAIVMVFTLFGVATMATARSHAAAQTPCSQWNVNGDWTLPDGQGGVAERLTLTRVENVIKGSGYSSYWESIRRDAAGNRLPA